MQKKRVLVGLAAAIIVAVGSYFAYAHWTAKQTGRRESLLRQLPVTATSVIFVDVARLREGGLLKNVATWTASPTEDPDYQTFVRETGFDYERDLNQFAVAIVTRDSKTTYFAVVDGHFDGKKISDYLGKNGSGEQ